jgi:hypothetical protein
MQQPVLIVIDMLNDFLEKWHRPRSSSESSRSMISSLSCGTMATRLSGFARSFNSISEMRFEK